MARSHHLKNKYGITQKEYDAKLADQNGGCGVCGRIRREGTRAYAVDHRHDTGEVRGIVCMQCNRWLIGCLEKCHKNPRQTLNGLVAYFQKYSLKGE